MVKEFENSFLTSGKKYLYIKEYKIHDTINVCKSLENISLTVRTVNCTPT